VISPTIDVSANRLYGFGHIIVQNFRLGVECPRIVSMDLNDLRLLGAFGESQVMGQPVAKGLLVSPSITGDFRGCYFLLARGNHASATLNHQKWPRAMMCPNPYRRFADTPVRDGSSAGQQRIRISARWLAASATKIDCRL
jgi:hypothetical protein